MNIDPNDNQHTRESLLKDHAYTPNTKFEQSHPTLPKESLQDVDRIRIRKGSDDSALKPDTSINHRKPDSDEPESSLNQSSDSLVRRKTIQKINEEEAIKEIRRKEELKKEKEAQKKKKWGVMASIFFTMLFTNFGNFYVFDIPQLFEDPLISQFGIDTVEISYLYAIYSIPNFIFAPLGSVLLNYTGLGLGAVIFSGCIFFSVVMVYLGVAQSSFTAIFIGRALLGIGGESLIVCQATMAEKWFTGSFLSLAIGMNTVMMLAGSALAAFLGPELYVLFRSMQYPIFCAGAICFLCWFLSFVYCMIEWRNLDMIENEDEKDDTKFTLKHVKFLGKLFWLLSIVFAFISMAYYQFTNFITDFLMHRFHYDYLGAKNLVALMPLFICIEIPIFSSVVVVIGRKGMVLMLAGLLAAASYLGLRSLPEEPSFKVTVCLFGVSCFYSLYSSVIWTSMTLVVPKQGTSVALGLATTIQNILMTSLPIVFGKINTDRTPAAYNTSLQLLTFLGVGALFFSAIVTIVDFKSGKQLHLPENSKSVLEQRSRNSDDFRRSTMLTDSMLKSTVRSGQESDFAMKVGKNFDDDFG
jgi:MFS family permease